MKKQSVFAPQVANGSTLSSEGFTLTDTQPGVMVPVWKKPDEETGEFVNKYRYLEGLPRQIRFDAKEGHFTHEARKFWGRASPSNRWPGEFSRTTSLILVTKNGRNCSSPTSETASARCCFTAFRSKTC